MHEHGTRTRKTHNDCRLSCGLAVRECRWRSEYGVLERRDHREPHQQLVAIASFESNVTRLGLYVLGQENGCANRRTRARGSGRLQGPGHALRRNLEISAELIDARDDSHIWGEQYSRKSSDIFAVQEEITKEMTTALRLCLTDDDEKRVAKNYTRTCCAA